MQIRIVIVWLDLKDLVKPYYALVDLTFLHQPIGELILRLCGAWVRSGGGGEEGRVVLPIEISYHRSCAARNKRRAEEQPNQQTTQPMRALLM